MIEALLKLHDAELGRLIRAVLTGSDADVKGAERYLYPLIEEIKIVLADNGEVCGM